MAEWQVNNCLFYFHQFNDNELMIFLQFFVAYSNCRTQFKDAVEFGMQQVDVIHRLAREYPDRFEMAFTNDGSSEFISFVIKC